jgi:cation-transporting ATPase E
MTGDGVNDILAMKDADCSVAMAAGSDAAIQAAQVVLLDSDFSKMPKIVAEGRRNINNIERSATLFLVKNIFSVLLALFSIINVLTYPLQPSQITMVSLVNIGIPGFFLAMEPNNKCIKGHFLVKVMLKAMPAALTDFLAIAALVIFSNTFGVDAEDVSVAATFLLAIVGFIILANISAPINTYRIRVIFGCIVIMCVGAFVFHDLFSISYVSTKCVMLFVLFAIATEPFMRYLTRIFTFIERRTQHLFNRG